MLDGYYCDPAKPAPKLQAIEPVRRITEADLPQLAPGIKDLPVARVVCAAVKFVITSTGKEIVFTGVRHYSHDMLLHILTYSEAGLLPGFGDPDRSVNGEELEEYMGFIDAYGRFLTRKEAWLAAEHFNQILPNIPGPKGILFSEYLY